MATNPPLPRNARNWGGGHCPGVATTPDACYTGAGGTCGGVQRARPWPARPFMHTCIHVRAELGSAQGCPTLLNCTTLAPCTTPFPSRPLRSGKPWQARGGGVVSCIAFPCPSSPRAESLLLERMLDLLIESGSAAQESPAAAGGACGAPLRAQASATHGSRRHVRACLCHVYT